MVKERICLQALSIVPNVAHLWQQAIQRIHLKDLMKKLIRYYSCSNFGEGFKSTFGKTSEVEWLVSLTKQILEIVKSDKVIQRV